VARGLGRTLTTLRPWHAGLATLVAIAASLATVCVFAVDAGAASKATDLKIAKAGLLRTSDFPSTWTQKKHDSSGDAEVEKAASKISSCQKYLTFMKTIKKNPRELSPDFELDQSSISNTVNVSTSVKAATSAMAAFGSSSMPTCLNKVFAVVLKAQFAKDTATAGQVSSISVQFTPLDGINLGDDSVVYQGIVTIELKTGESVQLQVGNAAVRVGRVVNDFSYSSTADISEVLANAIGQGLSRLEGALAAAS
jgi:hypothetical protein